MAIFRPLVDTPSSQSLLQGIKKYLAAIESHAILALAAVLIISGTAAGATLVLKNKQNPLPPVAEEPTQTGLTTLDTASTDSDNIPQPENPPAESAPAPSPAPTQQSKKTAPAPAPSSSSYFSTLPPGSSLPSDATCANKVKKAAETRPANAGYNSTKGNGANGRYPRVTGNYTGTTDEIIQWAACKWGVDENMARAQAAKESWWFQRTAGDFTTDPNICVPGHPLGVDGQPGKCPESIGLMQVRYLYHLEAFANNNATNSTAYNIDYAYAVWRDCYEGNLTWLNTVEKGSTYTGGDAWGCFGVWFSGRWMTGAAVDYINAVKSYFNQKIWEQGYFKSAT